MILLKIYISIALTLLINPHDLIFSINLRGIDALLPQWDLVLFVIVDRRHLLDNPDEYRDCVFREMSSGVSIFVSWLAANLIVSA